MHTVLTQVAHQDLAHHQAQVSVWDCMLAAVQVFANLKENAAPFPNVNSKWWYTKERLNLWELLQQPTLESPRPKNVLQAEVKKSDWDFTPKCPRL